MQNFNSFQGCGHPEYIPFIDHIINTYKINNITKYIDVTGQYNFGDFSLAYYVNNNLKVRYTSVDTGNYYDEPITIYDIE